MAKSPSSQPNPCHLNAFTSQTQISLNINHIKEKKSYK